MPILIWTISLILETAFLFFSFDCISIADAAHLSTSSNVANIASPKTISNLKQDPRIEINCVDIFSRRGYRFKGRGIVHSIGTQIHEDLLLQIKNEDGESIPVIDAILIEVLEAKPVLSPAYHFVKGVTEDSLRNAYMKKYNVRPLNEKNN